MLGPALVESSFCPRSYSYKQFLLRAAIGVVRIPTEVLFMEFEPG